MDVLYLIMLHIVGNVDKKFQSSIFYRSRENHVSSKTFQTYGHADISSYKVASLLKGRGIGGPLKTYVKQPVNLLKIGRGEFTSHVIFLTIN